MPTITTEREFGSLAIRAGLAGIEVWLEARKIGETEAGTALVMNNLAAGTTPVESYPEGVSPYGVHDMAGNVLEWVDDWSAANDYWACVPERNRRGPNSGHQRLR